MAEAGGQNGSDVGFFFGFCFYFSVLTLDTRQKRAEELKRLTDRSSSMSDEQLSELRADIKVTGRPCWLLSAGISGFVVIKFRLFFFQHFVSERKYDEDLGKAVRFTFDLEPLKSSITGFGSGRPGAPAQPGCVWFSSVVLAASHVTCPPLLWFSLPVYHPRTGYSNRSRCSSTSSSVTSPSLQETPPPPCPPTQTQNPPSEARPPPNKQVRPQFSLSVV